MSIRTVSAADYPENYFSPPDLGFGAGMDGVRALQEALSKAVTAGYGTDHSAFVGGRSLMVESLEQTLQDVLWGEKHIKCFKALKASALHSTVDEWTRRSSYGDEWGVAVAETANPPISSADLARQVDTVSFYRSRREVSHVMALVGTIDPAAEAEEEEAGTRQILGRVETDIFTGDRDVFPTRIRGLQSHILEQGGDLVYDAHGQPINTQDAFHHLAGVVYDEGGDITQVYLNPACHADINAALAEAERIVIPTRTEDGRIVHGATQTALAHAYGVMNFESDRFIRAGWTMKAPDSAVGPDASEIPGTPTVNSVAGNAGSIYDQTNLPAGDYYVRVSAVCEHGESAASAAQAVTLTAGNAIQITVTPADAKNTGYRVYLSAVNAADGSDCRFHCEIAATGEQQTLTIDGHWVTGSTNIYLLSMDPADRAIDWRQLLPLTRMNLAITGPVIPFLINLYGYLRVMKPNWHALIKNVIPSTVDWAPLG